MMVRTDITYKIKNANERIQPVHTIIRPEWDHHYRRLISI